MTDQSGQNLHGLHDLLDRATDGIEAPGGAVGALGEARRRRVRRRGAAAGLVAAAAVLVVVVGVRAAADPSESDGLPPAESPTATPTPGAIAPPIATSAIQPEWDPRGAEGEPVVDLGVPRVMEDLVRGEVDQPVALLDDGSRARLVSADGLEEEIPLPDGVGQWRTVSLSPDGTRLAVTGLSGFFWRSLDGDWQRVEVAEEQQVTGEGVSITWAPDSRSLVLRSHLEGVQVDLESGELTELPVLRGYATWAFTPDETVVTIGSAVREWVDGGDAADGTLVRELASLQRPVVSDTSIAATRGDSGWYGGQRGPADRDGLVAVERGTLETRAFLPVPTAATYYSDGGALSAVAWLDDDTVLFTVLPKDAPKEYLMTWDVETGKIFRVSCWLESDHAVFATDLLG